MPEIINNRGVYSLDFIMIPSEYIGQFNDFMIEYGDLSDYEIYRKISEIKGQVPEEVLTQHIQNLDALAKMEGLVTDMTKIRIDAVKQVLVETESVKPNNVDSNFFFGGSSLLLWFLILAGIWRRPFRGPRFGRPGFGLW